MQIGLFTDSLMHLSFEAALHTAAKLGVETVEVGTGNFSPAPHCHLDNLLQSTAARQEFLCAIQRRQLSLAALNCSGNPLHPDACVAQYAAEITHKTMRLAGLLGVDRVICMSGCPGGPEGGMYPNWVVAAWPEEFLELLNWQWNECVLPFWERMIALAKAEGVKHLCFELHPANNVYNPSSFQRLRTAFGPMVAANLDPSHFFFQGMDPLAVIRNLAGSISYVHAKDARVDPENLAAQGALDLQPDKPIRNLVWAYSTLGHGHDARFWSDFVATLHSVGYDGVLSIEHEDALMNPDEAVAESVRLLRKSVQQAAPREPRRISRAR